MKFVSAPRAGCGTILSVRSFEALHQGFSIINLKKLIDSVRYKTLMGQIQSSIKYNPSYIKLKKTCAI